MSPATSVAAVLHPATIKANARRASSFHFPPPLGLITCLIGLTNGALGIVPERATDMHVEKKEKQLF